MVSKELQRARYISFATFKRSGEAVMTPVWAGDDGDDLYVFSEADAGKIKRLRNFSRSRVAPCTALGRITGTWCNSEAYILEESEDIEQAYRALHRKYGWLMRLTDNVAKKFGRYDKRALIRIYVGNPVTEADG